MDLTFVFYDAIVLPTPDDGNLQKALSQVGAIRGSQKDHREGDDWYELTPEPIYAQLPYDPDYFKLDLPKIDVLGTAALTVHVNRFPPDYVILVIGAQTTIDTLHDTPLELPSWRSLVASPGKAVLKRYPKKVDWSVKGPELARVGSSGRTHPGALNLGLICRQRATVLGNMARTVNTKPITVTSKAAKRFPFGMSMGNALNISGIEFSGLEFQSFFELMMSASKGAADRILLDIILERLRKVAVEANREFDALDISQKSSFAKWLGTCELEFHNISEYLTAYSHLPPGDFPAVINRHLDIPFDAHRCHLQLTNLWQTLTTRTTIWCFSGIHGSLQDLSANVQASTESLEDRLRNTSLEMVEQFSSIASLRNLRAMAIALSASSFLLAGSVALDVLGFGLATIGLGFALMGVIWARRHNRQSWRGAASSSTQGNRDNSRFFPLRDD